MKFARLGTPGTEIPVLVEGDRYLDERHSRYVADHIPDATYARVPGDGALPALEDAPGSYVKMK